MKGPWTYLVVGLLLALTSCSDDSCNSTAEIDGQRETDQSESMSPSREVASLQDTLRLQSKADGEVEERGASPSSSVKDSIKMAVSRTLRDDMGNFLGSTDENDRYGHPVIEMNSLTIWENISTDRWEAYFNSSQKGTEYSLHMVDGALIHAFEGVFTPEGEALGDSLFFSDGRLVYWKSMDGRSVTDPGSIRSKQRFITALAKSMEKLKSGLPLSDKNDSRQDKIDRIVEQDMDIEIRR